MSIFMVQASYSTAATSAMIKNPQDRGAAIKPIIEKMGGKLLGAWLSFGDYDIVVIAEVPDNVGAAALALAVGATGAMSAYRTTPLMTTDESMKAMKMAGKVGYQPPK